MRRHFAFIFGAVLLVVSASFSYAAEIIDGVVATVNRTPLLRSEWDEAVRVEAFMQQKRLADASESQRVAALQRLIDRQLLNAQMADSRGLRPSDEAARADLAKLRQKFPGATDDARWKSLLASYGLTEAVIVAHLKDEVQVMNYIDVQLRPSVHIQDSEVQAYYHTRLVPDVGVEIVDRLGRPPGEGVGLGERETVG